MPLGNPTHRFSANKEWLFLRTNSLLISKARPTQQWIPVLCMQSPRSETTGQGWPSAQDVLWRGCFMHSFSLYSSAVFSPRRCPWFPWGCIRLPQGGVAPSLLHLQPSTAKTAFPGRCWPSALSVSFTSCSDLEQVEKKPVQSVGVFYHSQDLGWMFPSALQRTKSSLSFWIAFP